MIRNAVVRKKQACLLLGVFAAIVGGGGVMGGEDDGCGREARAKRGVLLELLASTRLRWLAGWLAGCGELVLGSWGGVPTN